MIFTAVTQLSNADVKVFFMPLGMKMLKYEYEMLIDFKPKLLILCSQNS